MLHNFNLSSEDLDMIAECVASHEGTSKIKTLEAEIVHDADVLEKTGVLGIIRHTWKLTNSEKISHTHVTKKDAEEVLRHLHWRAKKLQTSLGRKMGRHLSIVIPLNQVQVIISIVAEKAFVGIVTEKIARLLYKKLTVPQKEKLQEQLNMSYLKKF